ncbi:MAG: DUF362 domain-containing protein [Phycisphaerae bacterium]|nr:DUF362 domain-containing protein [Phycisphaerae bacterium]
MLTSRSVAISAGHGAYPQSPPYSPQECYPEYPFRSGPRSPGPNAAYAAVRQALQLLELDTDRSLSAGWNPLTGIIKRGDTVVLKPNFVREFRETRPGHGDCLITHGSVIRAVLDYAYLALEGCGRIIIADAPHNDADFEAIARIAGLQEIQDFYRRHAGFEVEVYDLRPERARKIDGVIVGHEPLPGDPAGYVRVNLGLDSEFAEINHLCHRLYGSEYDTSEIRRHHHDDVHEYLISKTVLDADVVISLPKLKTHKKTGMTVNLKNLVGINGNKNWLPHHREGTPSQGGDQFADDGLVHHMEQRLMTGFRRVFPLLGPLRSVIAGPAKSLGTRVFGDTNNGTIRSGNWYGNDTTWRMVLDLNRILLYADTEGGIHDRPVRRFFSIVDGVIGGEGNGPLDPEPKPLGIVTAGFNAVAVDLACARLMGFDRERLPMLKHAYREHPLPLCTFPVDDITCCSNTPRFQGRLSRFEGPGFAFAPHFGWRNHISIGG